jgi:glycosyltransferase involved in cell wall biosynthesis
VRILVATDQWFPDRLGGLARVASETAAGLARRGHEVVVLAPATGAAADDDPPGVAVERVLPQSRLPHTVTDVVATVRAARGRVRRFDLLVGHTSTTSSALATVRDGVPLVHVFHASAPLELRFLRTRLASRKARAATVPLEALLVRLERRSLRAADRVLVLSEFSRGLVADAVAAGRIVGVDGGVDVARFAPREGARARLGLDPDAPLLVAVRRLEPRMGLEQLVAAMSELPDVRLALIGSGSLDRRLAELVREHGLDGRVRLVGRVGDAELPDWYRAADLAVVPSAAYEGFGLATAEALACGTPVVGTPVGATPELLEPLEPRLVARGADAPALARAIADALPLAPALRDRAAAYARDRFGWEHVLDGWERALVEAASAR